MINQKLIDKIAKALLQKKETVGIAESVTSGNMQAALSLGESAALFLQGGITTYNVVQKCDHLGVDLSDAITSNCVSQEVSSQMAESACTLFSASWGIACTGYATHFIPHTDKGLFACYAIARNGKTVKKGRISSSARTARNVQLDYTEKVLSEFLKVISNRRAR